MSDHIAIIAQLLTEDPDTIKKSIDKIDDRMKEQSGLEPEDYIKAMAILKDVAKNNGCSLDEDALAPIELSPGAISAKNVMIRCDDPNTKRKLKQRLSDTLGDNSINNAFDNKLHTNLYQAINAEFADRLQEEGLEVSHNAHAEDGQESDHVDLTFTRQTIRAKQPEEAPEDLEGEDGLPPPEAPLEGPEGPPAAPEPPPAEGGAPGPMAGPPEGPPMGEFGMEPPPEAPPEDEELLPPPDEDEAMINFEQVQRIAGMLTEDPDIFNY